MRKVKCSYYCTIDKKWVNIEEWKFHWWGVAYEEFESWPWNYTIWIVELINWQIITSYPTDIKFLDL